MKKMTMFLLLATVPPAAMRAQNTRPAEQPGKTFCGHAMDAGTFVDARAQNASHEEALVMRWLDPKGTTVHSALFIGRCVAKDGDTIDGKVIARVLPNSLAISNRHGLTAWEAEYWNYPGEQAGGGMPHRGVFNENRFVAELDASKASDAGTAGSADPDFRWNDEQETLAVKLGVVLVPSPVHYTYQGGTPNPQPAPTQPQAKPNCAQQQGPKVNIHVPKKPSAWACKTLGICADEKPVALNGDSGCPAAPANGQPPK